MQADRNTTNIRSFYSVTNNQRNTLRPQQRTAKRQRVPLTATASRMLIAAYVRSHGIYIAQPPMGGSIKADNLAIFPFGVLVRQTASSKYLVDNQHNGVNNHCHPSTSAHGVSLTPTGAAICRDNDLADGVRVLFFLRSRLLGTIGAGGVTPTGLVTFRTEQSALRIVSSTLANLRVRIEYGSD
ncbi:hypothetical protein T12_9931, partial [Trichinella patagoniensis]